MIEKLPCPHCDSQDLSIKESRVRPGYLRRRYICKDCGVSFLVKVRQSFNYENKCMLVLKEVITYME